MSEAKKQTRRAAPKVEHAVTDAERALEAQAIEDHADQWFRYSEGEKAPLGALRATRLLLRAILQVLTPEQRAEVLRKVKL
jgi:hypothetical protein